MNIFTKRGQEAKESANGNQVDLKKIFIKLKQDESVRVRLLSTFDYVEYMSVGDFKLGIYTQPSLLPLGKADALDEAKNIAKSIAKDDENHELFPYTRLYSKKRYIFAFADIDSGELRVWDASITQAKGIIKQIEKYAEDINDICFDFSRTGTGTETKYSLDPILRLKGDDQEKFDKVAELVVTDELFNSVLLPRTYEQQLEALEQSGFPMEHFNLGKGENFTEAKKEDVEMF